MYVIHIYIYIYIYTHIHNNNNSVAPQKSTLPNRKYEHLRNEHGRAANPQPETPRTKNR